MENFYNGWGGPAFGTSLLGILLSVLLDPNNSLFAKHPICSPDLKIPDDFSEWSDDDKKAFMEEHLNDYWKKYYDKIKAHNEEDYKQLEESLKDVNEDIRTLNDKRQEIIDDWIMK